MAFRMRKLFGTFEKRAPGARLPGAIVTGGIEPRITESYNQNSWPAGFSLQPFSKIDVVKQRFV